MKPEVELLEQIGLDLSVTLAKVSKLGKMLRDTEPEPEPEPEEWEVPLATAYSNTVRWAVLGDAPATRDLQVKFTVPELLDDTAMYSLLWVAPPKSAGPALSWKDSVFYLRYSKGQLKMSVSVHGFLDKSAVATKIPPERMKGEWTVEVGVSDCVVYRDNTVVFQLGYVVPLEGQGFWVDQPCTNMSGNLPHRYGRFTNVSAQLI